jgi:hypothetical protein
MRKFSDISKNLYLALVVALLLALPATSVTASQVDNMETIDLLADQDVDVGDIVVWNDADTLYVRYELTGDWCLAETHVDAFLDADAFSDVPHKNGNPIPGKFELGDDFALYPCIQEAGPYLFPLDGANTINVAAHAKVVRPIADCFEQTWQIGDVETLGCNDGATLTNYADEFNWGASASACSPGDSLAAYVPVYTDPFIVGTTPVSEFPYNSNHDRSYADDFDVQWDGGLPFGGKLSLSWSPGGSGNEIKLVSDGFGAVTFQENGGTSATGFNHYKVVENYVLVPPQADGTHTIRFQQTAGNGTWWDWVRMEKVCEQSESAWAAGSEFPGRNWATFFSYAVFAPYAVGDVDLYRPVSPDDDWSVEFEALEMGPSGMFLWEQEVNGSYGFHKVPEVDTVMINGNEAIFSGIVIESHKAARIGTRLWLRAYDNGANGGSAGNPDTVGAFWGATLPASPAWSYYEVISGDILVVDYYTP